MKDHGRLISPHRSTDKMRRKQHQIGKKLNFDHIITMHKYYLKTRENTMVRSTAVDDNNIVV